MNSNFSVHIQYNEFLTNTILSTIASSMVQIIREHPEDPIMFLAERLLAESKVRQDTAYSEAHKKFIELLNS